jgi:hypothetical protein
MQPRTNECIPIRHWRQADNVPRIIDAAAAQVEVRQAGATAELALTGLFAGRISWNSYEAPCGTERGRLTYARFDACGKPIQCNHPVPVAQS